MLNVVLKYSILSSAEFSRNVFYLLGSSTEQRTGVGFWLGGWVGCCAVTSCVVECCAVECCG